MTKTAMLPFLSVVGPKMKALSVQKTKLPDGTCILRGRVRRARAGELKVEFGHHFDEPESVVVLVNGNFHRQVGFIETVTEIHADHFIVTSDNAHEYLSFVSWIAFGGNVHTNNFIAIGR